MSIIEQSNQEVIIIAEAGVNHGGDLDLAKQLIDIAASAGANAVKFQAFRTEHLILDNIDKAPYQLANTSDGKTQSEMLKELELRTEHYAELKAYCEKKGILFLITPFDEVSLEELETLGVEAYKVASTDTTNIPFLRKLAATGKPILLSTGMCYLSEVEVAVKAILDVNPNLILMQCTANYPIQDDEANLNVLHTYREKFPAAVLGYSDHTVGLGASPYAIPLGARVIEKHFTIDKEADGPDHRASLNPDELHAYVAEVRRVEDYLGSREKKPTESEMGTRKSLQKCLVTTRELAKGEEIGEGDIIAKRTGGKGISPIYFDKIVGMKAEKDYLKNEIISVAVDV